MTTRQPRNSAAKREPAQQLPPQKLRDCIRAALDDTKAEAVEILDVREMTDVTDFMVICSGSSDRHVQAIARNAQDALAKQGIKPLSTEGETDQEWILLDYVDVLVHIMKRETRAFYDLSSLWNPGLGQSAMAEHP